MTNLSRLTLTNFRNYDRFVWEPEKQKVVLYGSNASGKTNLLEAISLLVPGKGLRKARIEEIVKLDRQQQGWGVVGEFLTGSGSTEPKSEFTIATGCFPFSAKRQFKINNKMVSGHYEVSKYLSAIWLTPQMDRLFLEGTAGRRRFLDQLITGTESYYAKELTAYEKSVAQRNKLLSLNKMDEGWLNAIEGSMARHAVAVTVARIVFIQQLNQISAMQEAFPEVSLSLICPVAEFLHEHPALATEDYLKHQWRKSRLADAENRTTALGCHKADVAFVENKSKTPAYLASTGQQKAILISIVLKLVALVKKQKKTQPLLLLDEPLTHLDVSHREMLLSALLDLQGFVLCTGNDKELFSSCFGKGEFLHVEQGKML